MIGVEFVRGEKPREGSRISVKIFENVAIRFLRQPVLTEEASAKGLNTYAEAAGENERSP